jgi:hypothetical protein
MQPVVLRPNEDEGPEVLTVFLPGHELPDAVALDVVAAHLEREEGADQWQIFAARENGIVARGWVTVDGELVDEAAEGAAAATVVTLPGVELAESTADTEHAGD